MSVLIATGWIKLKYWVKGEGCESVKNGPSSLEHESSSCQIIKGLHFYSWGARNLPRFWKILSGKSTFCHYCVSLKDCFSVLFLAMMLCVPCGPCEILDFSGFITSLWWGANGASPLPLLLLRLCVLRAPACPRLDRCHFDWYFHIVWLKAGVLNGRLSIKLSWCHSTEALAASLVYYSFSFIMLSPPWQFAFTVCTRVYACIPFNVT